MDYFTIPHADKDQAKALGARWSNELKLWYAADPVVSERLSSRWSKTTPPQPVEDFPGEDRAWGCGVAGGDVRLAVDMIPASCLNTGVASCVSKEDWKRITLGVLARAHRHCEVCRDPGEPKEGNYLQVQERWAYEDGTQALKRLVCVCSRCHLASQFGRAVAQGHESAVRQRLLDINGWTGSQLETHLREAYAAWSRRSSQAWALDLSIIEAAGISVHLPTPEERRKRGVDLTTLRQ